MYKKMSKLILIGLCLNAITFNATAAGKGYSQNGLFFGAETGIFTTHYPMTYSMRVSTNPNRFEQFNSKEVVDEMPLFVVMGGRYYLPFAKPVLQKLGFGIKGWFGFGTHSGSNTYTSSGSNGTAIKTETFGTKADSMRYGVEGQIYYDLARFKFLSKESSIGLHLGAGYEIISFSDIRQNMTEIGDYPVHNALNNSVAYDDASQVYSGGISFTVGVHRLDVGYRQFDYSKSITTHIYNTNPNTSGINPKSAVYVTYSVTL